MKEEEEGGGRRRRRGREGYRVGGGRGPLARSLLFLLFLFFQEIDRLIATSQLKNKPHDVSTPMTSAFL
jgi:hypothetical protein